MGKTPQKNPLARGLIALAALVLFAGLAAGYESSLTRVTLVVDGVPRQVNTQQETVAALLVDKEIVLRPEDHVVPAPDTPVTDGLVVQITRARLAQIDADGYTWHVYTHATTAEAILAEAGLVPGVYDRVTLEETLSADASPILHVVLYRAVPIVLHEDGQAVTLHTTADTVGEALSDLGITLYLADRVEPGQGDPLSAGMHVYLERSQPVTVHVDGRTIRTRTHRDRVGDVLSDLGIVLTGQDYTSVPLDQPVEGNAEIDVVRVEERFLIQQEPIPF
ncbi:MAG: DUF348 domain-containing protein, partial [Anaerolineae bacterium]|nr:DUF348 domain-containing protein [Anaerolineae bacterium]